MATIDRALAYYDQGWRDLIPLNLDKTPDYSLLPQKVNADGVALWVDERGKETTVNTARPKKTWKREESVHPQQYTREEVAGWFKGKPDRNYGIRTGQVNGIIAVDTDSEAAHGEAVKRGLPTTRTHRSGRRDTGAPAGGWHHLYKYDPRIAASKPIDGCDVKSDGGYIVGDGSTHQDSRALYTVETDGPLAMPPDWLIVNRASGVPAENTPVRTVRSGSTSELDEIRHYLNYPAIAAKGNECQDNWIAVKGILKDAGGSLADFDQFSRSCPEKYANNTGSNDIEKVWDKTGKDRASLGKLKMWDKEVNGGQAKRDWLKLHPELSSRRQSRSKGSGPAPSSFQCTDIGNAERLIARHGEKLRFCHVWGLWLIWNGHIWKPDTDDAITRLAIDTIRSIYQEAAECDDPTARTILAKHATKSEAASRLAAMIKIATALDGVSVTPDALDCDHWLVTCENGTLDLKTGNLRESRPADLITKLIPVTYSSDATCPEWDKFLARIMDNRATLITFLQRAIGYSLTGDTSEQVLFLLHGLGSNGKSTFIETLMALFGDLSQTADMNSFLHRDGEGPRNDLAKLVGARFVSAVEVKAGKRLDETLIKQLTGGDKISTRFLFKEFFEYRPCYKLWIAANHKPVIRGTDHAIWRRIRLVPFDVTIADGEKDKQLTRKLRAELPGVLAWVVRGCLAWQADGLQEPPEVLAATESYRDEMDYLSGFIAERCIKGAQFRAKSSDLYRNYQQWCEQNGETPVSQNKFGLTMTERGFPRVRANGGIRQYIGIGLRTNENSDTVTECDTDSGKVFQISFHETTLPKTASQSVTPSLGLEDGMYTDRETFEDMAVRHMVKPVQAHTPPSKEYRFWRKLSEPARAIYLRDLAPEKRSALEAEINERIAA